MGGQWAVGSGIGCNGEVEYLLSGGVLESDVVAQGSELGDVVVRLVFGVDA
jgi:hypothetical protein